MTFESSECTDFRAAARRVAAVCAAPDAAHVQSVIYGCVASPKDAATLWLTWVQWRAMGREMLTRETGLSLWILNGRLRQLREAGIAIPSLTEERDLLARGRFHLSW